MNSKYISELLGAHAAWIEKGLSSEDIRQAHSDLKNEDPFINYGYSKICSRLGIFPLENYDKGKINYLFIDDVEFDGNLNHFNGLNNLEELDACGINFDSKISDLSPLIRLEKLRYVDVRYNAIVDVMPLLEFPSLLSIILDENPIKNISALQTIRNLRSLKYVDLNDDLVTSILNNNPDCEVEYCNRDNGDCYVAFNLFCEAVKVTGYYIDEMAYFIVELTFINHKVIPIEDEIILNNDRVMNWFRDGYSNDFFTYEVHQNAFYIRYKLNSINS